MRKSVLDKQQKLYLCSVFVFLLGAVSGLILMFIGESKSEYNTMAIGVMTIWSFNLAFCCFKLKRRIVTFLFHLTVFLFLMSRFIIAFGRGDIWWTRYSIEANKIALYAIAFALIAIAFDAIAIEIVLFYFSRLQEKNTQRPRN